MKTTRLLVFAIFILFVLNANVCPLFAQAPTTPKILFTSARDGNREVYIMNPDGSEQVNLTKHPADDLQAVWSPTGEKILFVSDRSRGVRDLYTMNPDGANVRRVFRKKIEPWRTSPTWSPDGKRFAYSYTHWDAGKSYIHIATLGKQETEEFIVDGFAPAWSPDGTEIAYTALPVPGWGEVRRVTLIDIHTRKRKFLLPKKAMSWQNRPSWSTTGDKLVFSWCKHPFPPDFNPRVDRFPPKWRNKETIYIVNRDGTELQQLVGEDGNYAQNPMLSPNGDEVLYTQEVNGRFQIFKADVNSGIRTQLTHIGDFLQANSDGDWFDPAYTLSVSPQPQLLTTTWGEVKKQ